MGEIRIAVADDSPPFLAAASEYIAHLPGCAIAPAIVAMTLFYSPEAALFPAKAA